MRQSVKILRQTCKGIPGGSTENLEARRMAEGRTSKWNHFEYQYIVKKVPPTFKISLFYQKILLA